MSTLPVVKLPDKLSAVTVLDSDGFAVLEINISEPFRVSVSHLLVTSDALCSLYVGNSLEISKFNEQVFISAKQDAYGICDLTLNKEQSVFAVFEFGRPGSIALFELNGSKDQ